MKKENTGKGKRILFCPGSSVTSFLPYSLLLLHRVFIRLIVLVAFAFRLMRSVILMIRVDALGCVVEKLVNIHVGAGIFLNTEPVSQKQSDNEADDDNRQGP
jgi:hypothetical protein